MATDSHAAARTIPDLVYATHDGSPLHLDVHLPPGPGPHPCLMWIHGGGWRYGSRNPGRYPKAVVEAGIACASIDYRLSDHAHWPAPILDCAAAARWLRAHGRAHRIDSARLAVGGESAGGHLAALLGLMGAGDPQLGPGAWSGLSAVLAVCAVVDLERHLAQHKAQPSNQIEMLGLLFNQDLSAGRLRAASPASHVRGDAPPVLFVHASGDPVVAVDPVRDLHAALERAGTRPELAIMPGDGHFGLPEMGDAALPVVRRFLSRHLGLAG